MALGRRRLAIVCVVVEGGHCAKWKKGGAPAGCLAFTLWLGRNCRRGQKLHSWPLEGSGKLGPPMGIVSFCLGLRKSPARLNGLGPQAESWTSARGL